MLFKIFGIERAVKGQIRQNLLSKPLRQLFVTQSRVLAGRVEDYYKKLSDFLQTAYMSKDELRERHRSKKNEEEEELVDLDEEEWHEDLPKRFSELEDRHFPLFLTFDKVRILSHMRIKISNLLDLHSCAKCLKLTSVCPSHANTIPRSISVPKSDSRFQMFQ